MPKNAFYPIKLYLKNRYILIVLVLSLIINISIWGWLLWNIRPQEELIFLHYNILFGVDLIGEWWRILYIPIAGIFINLINAFIGWVFFHKDKFVAYLLNTVGLFCEIFLLISASLLVFLNI